METQSNTNPGGPIVFATTTDLTGKEGHVAKLTNNAGKPAIALPAAATDLCPYLILRVNSATEVEVQPISPVGNYRAKLSGAVVPGGTLILGTAANAGKYVAAATGAIQAVAEEAGVDGQLVLVRAISRTLA